MGGMKWGMYVPGFQCGGRELSRWFSTSLLALGMAFRSLGLQEAPLPYRAIVEVYMLFSYQGEGSKLKVCLPACLPVTGNVTSLLCLYWLFRCLVSSVMHICFQKDGGDAAGTISGLCSYELRPPVL